MVPLTDIKKKESAATTITMHPKDKRISESPIPVPKIPIIFGKKEPKKATEAVIPTIEYTKEDTVDYRDSDDKMTIDEKSVTAPLKPAKLDTEEDKEMED